MLTLIAIAKQAKEAAAASRAAARSTDTFVQSERAWIIATPVELAPQVIADEIGSPQGNGVRLSVRNAGKGIARIDSTAISYILLAKEDWEKLGKEPLRSSKDRSYHGLILVPTDSLPLDTVLEPCLLNLDEANAIRRGDKVLFAYGLVNYRDGFDVDRMTRFGYRYYFPQGGLVSIEETGFRREPSAYNQAT